jgi:hypothetical protein
MRGLALAAGLATLATATPASAYCYKFRNSTTAPRTLILLGSGGLTASVAPGATWPEHGDYCAYGMNVIVKVEPGSIDAPGPFIAGDGPTATPPGTYVLK